MTEVGTPRRAAGAQDGAPVDDERPGRAAVVPAEPAPETVARRPVILGRHRSVVATALLFALGAALAYVLLRAVEQVRGVLVLAGLSLLIALTLDPLVTALERRRVPRWAAALLAWLLAVSLLAAPVVMAVRAGTTQLPRLVDDGPALVRQAEDNLGALGDRLREVTASGSSSRPSPDQAVNYLLHGGQVVFRTAGAIVVVALLSLFVLITLPRLLRAGYLLVPRSRREAVETAVEDLRGQVSRFMLANVLTSLLAGAATWGWAVVFGIPYAALLGALVAVLDLVPTVGSTVGGVVVSLVALTQGLGVAAATLAFYVAFRLAEDYLIQPRALRYSVELPGVVTVPAVLAGGAVLGVAGALFAVPVALAVRVLVRDLAMPALDRR